MSTLLDSPVVAALQHARTGRSGIGAFNVVLLEHAEAIVDGAERAGVPVILQISQNCIAYHGALEPLTAATLALARRSPVPAIVHLDHADDVDLVHRAVASGVDSVMFDGSHLPYEDNVRVTREVVEHCHAHGVPVEAELGEVGGKDGVHAPGARTDPAQAAAFVAATGVDSLAVAVGSSHAMTERVATLDLDLVAALAAVVPVPLVLHGSSGVADDQLSAAVRAGMTKVNISTHLNGLFTRAVREVLDADPALVDPRKYVAPARAAVAREVQRLLRLLAEA
ncbi:class II fructose-bisphosphate aldolase [Kineococcus radiotolerans]|uniref:Ketose-bisphosphate aldolase n=1 Tax=Kineococcus radiotolerans (strain ATCC BAA-149 / DSM 14245 / SRS30216) TaxID=266940 RepID=A6WA02_KINRD|nr:class II fructose-bisphosphate aldolase [Kineococcus radiotolerans]ABS03641.1 ketose-bisphosphate aldolase [Kineococcus radiotolerans SRS30216 = ATCC BAA-149]